MKFLVSMACLVVIVAGGLFILEKYEEYQAKQRALARLYEQVEIERHKGRIKKARLYCENVAMLEQLWEIASVVRSKEEYNLAKVKLLAARSYCNSKRQLALTDERDRPELPEEPLSSEGKSLQERFDIKLHKL